MQISKIFLFIISLLAPIILVIAGIFFHFLMFGEGMESEKMFDKYGWLYILGYAFIAVLHVFGALKLFRDNPVHKRIIASIIVVAMYAYVPLGM